MFPIPSSSSISFQRRPGSAVASGWFAAASAVCFALVLSGCATPQSKNGQLANHAPVEPVVTVPTMNEYLGLAQVAESTEGGKVRARSIYGEAAKTYPADKRPWLKLSQSYFDTADYGNAIIAAQEAIQRDPDDASAQGLLAVSGLRVSTAALSVLRNRNGLNTSTRSEAENMARNLRTILRDHALAPKTANAVQAEVQSQVKAKAISTAKAAVASTNPFGALK